MALTVDATTQGTHSTTSPSFTHTCTGSDLVLYVAFCLKFSDTITGVTYNGVAMTNIASEFNSNDVSVSVWRLINPDTGTNTCAATLSTARRSARASISFAGADQTTPNGTPVTDQGSSASAPSVAVSSAADEIVVDFVALLNDDNTSTLTVGADQTERMNQGNSSGTTGVRGGASTEPGAGTVTMSWTPDANDEWAQVALAVKPSAAVAGATSYFPLLGIG